MAKPTRLRWRWGLFRVESGSVATSGLRLNETKHHHSHRRPSADSAGASALADGHRPRSCWLDGVAKPTRLRWRWGLFRVESGSVATSGLRLNETKHHHSHRRPSADSAGASALADGHRPRSCRLHGVAKPTRLRWRWGLVRVESGSVATSGLRLNETKKSSLVWTLGTPLARAHTHTSNAAPEWKSHPPTACPENTKKKCMPIVT